MYCWHLVLLHWNFAASPTFPPFLDYYYLGVAIWALIGAGILAFWTSVAVEFPIADIWRLIETPFMANLKPKKKSQAPVESQKPIVVN